MKIKILLIIMLSIFLVSCSVNISNPKDLIFNANQANEIEFIVPDDFLSTNQNSNLKFKIKNNINANNDYTITVTTGEFLEKVKPFKDNYEFTLIGDKEVFKTGEKKELNLGLVKFSDLLKRHPYIESPVFVNVCSDYEDILFGNVCVFAKSDHCGGDTSFSSFNQKIGGPISISEVEFNADFPDKTAKLEVIITLSNNEDGRVYTSSNYADACRNFEVISKEEFVRDDIEVDYIRLNDVEFDNCVYNKFGFDDDIDEAQIVCKMDQYLLSPTIDSNIKSRFFSMKLNYNYIYTFKEILTLETDGLTKETASSRRLN